MNYTPIHTLNSIFGHVSYRNQTSVCRPLLILKDTMSVFVETLLIFFLYTSPIFPHSCQPSLFSLAVLLAQILLFFLLAAVTCPVLLSRSVPEVLAGGPHLGPFLPFSALMGLEGHGGPYS